MSHEQKNNKEGNHDNIHFGLCLQRCVPQTLLSKGSRGAAIQWGTAVSGTVSGASDGATGSGGENIDRAIGSASEILDRAFRVGSETLARAIGGSSGSVGRNSRSINKVVGG